MNELPELRSDADVDALMARIRMKLSAGTPAATQQPIAQASGDALLDVLVAQEEQGAAVLHALHLVTGLLEDLHVETEPQDPPVQAALNPSASTTRSSQRVRRGATDDRRAGTPPVNSRRRKKR